MKWQRFFWRVRSREGRGLVSLSNTVYLSLGCALTVSAVGVYLHLLWNIGGLLTTSACMGSIVWLLSTPTHEERKRVGLLMAAALFEGASIGLLMGYCIVSRGIKT
ncbi:bax inhibitor 1-like [Macadamia integrifolia]|uniref:bax inhibitor 1-like n=1 Tax=Macadamia integrifolia TaxID=60698 RepID=UPI001C4F5E31|nr:bax inhibitor 1-like [Macadamia integrifolia]